MWVSLYYQGSGATRVIGAVQAPEASITVPVPDAVVVAAVVEANVTVVPIATSQITVQPGDPAVAVVVPDAEL